MTLVRPCAPEPPGMIALIGERYQALLDKFNRELLLKPAEIRELLSAVARLRVSLALTESELKKARAKNGTI